MTTQISDYTLRRWQEYAEVILANPGSKIASADANRLKAGIDFHLNLVAEERADAVHEQAEPGRD